MNTGQMLLVLGAMALLSLTILAVNRALVENEQASLEGAFQLAATSLGEALLEEVARKEFDEAVVSTLPTTMPESFTAPGSLNPEMGESYSSFDDVDDFNGYTRRDTTEVGVPYRMDVKVRYWDDAAQDTTTIRTFLKRVEVTVSSPYLTDDTVLYHVVSFWNY